MLAGRGPQPTAAVIDSQSVKAADTVGKASRGPGSLHTFQVLPRRWVVERTFGWITKNRRCVRDYERLPEHHETYLYWSMIHVMAARVARHHSGPPEPVPGPARPQAGSTRALLHAA